MGALADAVDRISRLIPERKVSIGAAVQTWEAGTPQNPSEPYFRFALEGYSRNELVYACIEELATSAAEPRLAAMHRTDKKPEQIQNHPILDLFEQPNPFLSRFQFIASIIMYRAIAGNCYIQKVRSAAGVVVELWLLRPDRMFVIPDERQHIRGYEYRLGAEKYFLPAADVIHSRTRNPLSDWYGLPPLAASAQRVDTDNFMRAFTASFFRNAGVPAGLLNVTKQVTSAEKQIIKDRFRGEVGSPGNWHNLLVLDQTEATYTPMGLPLGQAGIVLPELDEISEARIAMVFGVPLELIGARLGMVHGNRTTMKEARAGFWDETLAPQYQEIAADLSMGLAGEAWGEDFDYLEFDLSTVRALQEDEDAKHDRTRKDVEAGLLSIQEARVILGQDGKYKPGDLLMLGSRVQPMLVEEALKGAPAQEMPGTGGMPTTPGKDGTSPQQTPVSANGNGHGKLSPTDLAALQELAAGR